MRKVFSLPHDQDPEETVSASDPRCGDRHNATLWIAR
jgi:hypothetical protein